MSLNLSTLLQNGEMMLNAAVTVSAWPWQVFQQEWVLQLVYPPALSYLELLFTIIAAQLQLRGHLSIWEFLGPLVWATLITLGKFFYFFKFCPFNYLEAVYLRGNYLFFWEICCFVNPVFQWHSRSFYLDLGKIHQLCVSRPFVRISTISFNS